MTEQDPNSGTSRSRYVCIQDRGRLIAEFAAAAPIEKLCALQRVLLALLRSVNTETIMKAFMIF